MAQPKKKLSSSRGNRRRSHLHLEVPVFASCKNCNTTVMPHTVCSNCGFYRGRAVKKAA